MLSKPFSGSALQHAHQPAPVLQPRKPCHGVGGLAGGVLAHVRDRVLVACERKGVHHSVADRVQREERRPGAYAQRPPLPEPLPFRGEFADPAPAEVEGQQLVAGPRNRVEERRELARPLPASPEGAQVSAVQSEDPDFAVLPVGDVHGVLAGAQSHAHGLAELARRGLDVAKPGADRRHWGQLPLRRGAGVHDPHPRAHGVDRRRHRTAGGRRVGGVAATGRKDRRARRQRQAPRRSPPPSPSCAECPHGPSRL